MQKADYDPEIFMSIAGTEEMTVDMIRYLYDYVDTPTLASIASAITEDISGNRVSFVSNLILNYTNVCNVRCNFCAFYRTGSEQDSYTFTIDRVIEEIEKYYDRFGITQLLIQGGVNPSLDLDYYLSLFRRIKTEFPRIGINGLSTSEISFIAKKAKISVEDLLRQLKGAGLETVPGAGAEIFDADVRKILGRPKGSDSEWLGVMETAHRMGIKTTATMMFGHVENSYHRGDHLYRLLTLQRKYHGFLSFTPWNFEPGKTRLERDGLVTRRSGGDAVVRNIAISRIAFGHEIPVIQSSWLTNGIQMGQITVCSGANDWGGTIYDEKVIPATGKDVGNLRKETIIQALKDIGKVPVERDNLYRTVKVY